MQRPIVSICIPTYNRAEFLGKSIESICSQEFFIESDFVEIVVTDNASTDDTEAVVAVYTKLFPEKIRYIRNPQNLRDGNFVVALKSGRGEYRKLGNDTLVWTPGSVEHLCSLVKANISQRPVLFTSNSTLKIPEKKIICETFDVAIGTISYMSTWIACFGIWKEDLESIEDPLRSSSLKLIQTDLLFHSISKKGVLVVDDTSLFTVASVENKGDYNILEVFGKNYLELYQEYLLSGKLSNSTYESEKYKLFLHLLVPWVYRVQSQKTYRYGINDWHRYSLFYRNNFYRHFLYILAFVYGLRQKVLRTDSA